MPSPSIYDNHKKAARNSPEVDGPPLVRIFVIRLLYDGTAEHNNSTAIPKWS